jgi:hypothetical protein
MFNNTTSIVLNPYGHIGIFFGPVLGNIHYLPTLRQSSKFGMSLIILTWTLMQAVDGK